MHFKYCKDHSTSFQSTVLIYAVDESTSYIYTDLEPEAVKDWFLVYILYLQF